MVVDNEKPRNMRTFLIVWVGQMISIIGSGLTGFGLSVWIFNQTGKATTFALYALSYNVPRILLAPIAGSVADRYNRRKIMIVTDTAAALMTLITAVLLFIGNLQIWHIYTLAFFSSAFSSFQSPAYSASITMMVPKKDLARASGIQQMGFAVESILIPVIAGVLYAAIGLRGVILIDFLTYFFAIGALAFVHIPQPKSTTEGAAEKTSMWADAAFGWKYLRERPGLFGLLWYYAIVNFFLSLSGVLAGPMILSFGTEVELGIAQMAGGAGMLIGGVLMGVWGGPKKRKIWAVIGAITLAGIGYLLMGLRPSILVIAVGQFIFLFFIPISAAISQSVWQVKVPADIQGRVFAIRGMIASMIVPISNLIAGPLADGVFEPMLKEGGALYRSIITQVIGAGPGRGIGVVFICSAILMMITSVVVFSYPRIRNLEEEIPDALPNT